MFVSTASDVTEDAREEKLSQRCMRSDYKSENSERARTIFENFGVLGLYVLGLYSVLGL